jgi:Fic family protein
MSDLLFISRQEYSRAITKSVEDINDENAAEISRIFKRITNLLDYKAERHTQRLDRRKRSEKHLSRLADIGPAYEIHRSKTTNAKALKLIASKFNVPSQTVDHYIREHEKMKTLNEKNRRNKLILSMYAAGFFDEEIAGQVGLSQRQVERIIAHARKVNR